MAWGEEGGGGRAGINLVALLRPRPGTTECNVWPSFLHAYLFTLPPPIKQTDLLLGQYSGFPILSQSLAAAIRHTTSKDYSTLQSTECRLYLFALWCYSSCTE